MSNYKLYYFNAKGRAEVTRWLFAIADVKYDDIRLTGEKWQEFKPSKYHYSTFYKKKNFYETEAYPYKNYPE